MEPAFDAPVVAIKPQHRLGIKLDGEKTGQQVFAFHLQFCFGFPVDKAFHLRGLGGMRESGLFRGDVKAQQAAGLRARAVDLVLLDKILLALRGKNRALGFRGAF